MISITNKSKLLIIAVIGFLLLVSLTASSTETQVHESGKKINTDTSNRYAQKNANDIANNANTQRQNPTEQTEDNLDNKEDEDNKENNADTTEPTEEDFRNFQSAEVIKIVDGDTIVVSINGTNYKVRLIGIDAPEINHPKEPVQCFGYEAKDYLATLISKGKVSLEKDVSDKDKYDRLLRYVWLDGELINERLVKDGYAFAHSYPPDTKYQERLANAEQYAKDHKLGLWIPSTCNGNVYTGTYKDPNKKNSDAANNSQDTSSNTTKSTTKSATNNTHKSNKSGSQSVKTSKYICDCSKTCKRMSSCEEAYFQLNQCGCSARDGDHDGIPCESICK